jgi:23S rRNA (adenine-N6)-dimethyltransferase
VQYLCDKTIGQSQNFLRSAVLVDRLLDASSIQSGDLVFDLGAGTGLISRRLALRGCEVVAVEKDPSLVARLRLEFAGVPNVQVRHCDIVRLDLPRQAYKVFSNIPFNATAEIVSRLTRVACAPRDAYFVVQREACDRFIGQPLTTLASVLLFPWFEATLVHEFRRTDFTPVPRVDVVMLRLHKRGPPLVAATDTQLFRDFVVRFFTARSPSLGDSLAQLVGKRRGGRLARALGVTDALPTRVPAHRWLELFDATVAVTGDELRWRVGHAERRLREQQHRLRKVHRTRSHHVRPPPCRRTWRGQLIKARELRPGSDTRRHLGALAR